MNKIASFSLIVSFEIGRVIVINNILSCVLFQTMDQVQVRIFPSCRYVGVMPMKYSESKNNGDVATTAE